MVEQVEVLRCIERLIFRQQTDLDQQPFDILMTLFGQFNRTLFFVHSVMPGRLLSILFRIKVRLTLKLGDQGINLSIQGRTVFGGARDNQRRTRLIDQDRIDLVDNGVAKRALDLIFGTEGHVIAQVIKAEFVIGAVGDIGAISSLFFLVRLAGIDNPDT